MARWSRFRRMFGPEPAADVDDELSFHIEMRTRELVEQGVPADRARALALQRFGDYDRPRNACVTITARRERRMARADYLNDLRHDITYALRTLRRAPAFAAVVLITLALGIGATSAIFAVVHTVLLSPLPFPHAERLYRVATLYPDGTPYSLSAPDFMSIREQTRALEQVEALAPAVFTMQASGEAREVRATRVSDGLFGLAGLTPVIGRALVSGDNTPGSTDVAVLDHGFWQREFGSDPNVIGRTLSLTGRSVEIVGVLAAGERLFEDSDLYVPLVYDNTFSAATAEERRGEFLTVVGRARPGMTLSQVDGDLKRIGTTLQAAFRDTNDTLTFSARELRDTIVGNVRTPLLMLLGAVGFVLLVACANVANLLLARASARRNELAVRAAIGAGRSRLVRQLLTESVVLGGIGAMAGLGVAHFATRALVTLRPADIPRLDELGLNWIIVAFTAATAVVTSLGFGVLPALRVAGDRLPDVLGGGTRGAGHGGQRVRASLVVAETALAVVLLIGAGLLIRSFVALTAADPGFRAERALAFRVVLQGEGYGDGAAVRQRVDEIETRLRSLPGVEAVAATSVLPLSGRGGMLGFAVESAPAPPPGVNPEIAVASVTPDYLRVIGAPLRRGRPFADADHAAAPLVAIANEAAVRRWFPDRDAIGARVRINGVAREVVGVARDVLQGSAAEPTLPMLFVPFAQRSVRSLRFVVRTAGDPAALTAAVRAQIRAADASLAVADIAPLTDLVTRSTARPRFYTGLLSLFAGVALVMAAIGIFGVMSYTVAQRAREIGIRMALGAQPGDVLRLVVGRALALSAAGGLMGVVAALFLGRFIQSQLFGVALLDVPTLAVVIIVLSASAILAAAIPARRAIRLDPIRTLRQP